MSRIVGTLAWACRTHEVVHRDLKPDNILLDGNKVASVSDWGLAKTIASADLTKQEKSRAEVEARPGLTGAGGAPFTAAYASPEQIAGSKSLDHRSDIYSLGILMYEWETGHLPFTGAPDQIVLRHLFEKPQKLGGIMKRTKFGVERLIAACIEKSPSKRPRDYREFERLLAEAGSKRGTTVREYIPGLRYEMPLVGGGNLAPFLANSDKAHRSADRQYAIVDLKNLEQFVREAEIPMASGSNAEARNTWERLFSPELTEGSPDYHQAKSFASTSRSA